MYGLDTQGRGLVHADAHWWHYKIMAELDRIGPYNVPGLAGNVDMARLDAEKYVRQMIEWGWLTECEPQWEYPALWVKPAQ